MNGTKNQSEKLKMTGTYPLADRMTYRESENLFRLYGPRYERGTKDYAISSAGRLGAKEAWIKANVKAAPTGEKRPPKKGEWYLSGSLIAAYQAPKDLNTVHHIATIVRLEQVVTTIKHAVTLDDGPTMGDVFHD